MTTERHVPWCGGGHDGPCAPVVLCGIPDGTERTVREWDALAARQGPRTPLGERLAGLILCPACFLPRFVPSHWFTCGGEPAKASSPAGDDRG